MTTILLILAVLGIVALLIFISHRPSEFVMSRSATMAAPMETVFAEVNDFHRWNAWSPWAKMDPNATNTFEDLPPVKERSSAGLETRKSAQAAWL